MISKGRRLRQELEAAEIRAAEAERKVRMTGWATGGALAADVATGGHMLFSLAANSILPVSDVLAERDAANEDVARLRRELSDWGTTKLSIILGTAGYFAWRGIAKAIEKKTGSE